MKYAIVKVINGNFSIDSEWTDNLKGAKVKFHDVAKTLWNAPDVLDAYVEIVDENLDCVEQYKEYIHHDIVTVETTPEAE